MKTPLTKEKILSMNLQELISISPEEERISKLLTLRERKFVSLRSGFIAILQGAFMRHFSFREIARSGAEIFSLNFREVQK